MLPHLLTGRLRPASHLRSLIKVFHVCIINLWIRNLWKLKVKNDHVARLRNIWAHDVRFLFTWRLCWIALNVSRKNAKLYIRMLFIFAVKSMMMMTSSFTRVCVWIHHEGRVYASPILRGYTSWNNAKCFCKFFYPEKGSYIRKTNTTLSKLSPL